MYRTSVAFALMLLVGACAAEAQQARKVYRIGYLSVASPAAANAKPFLDEFRAELRELGYVEGQNIVIEYRWAEGKHDRLPELAADLARLKLDVIIAMISSSARAAHQATRTIPIVMVGVGDPIRLGLAASLARPGGNVTGSTSYGPELRSKMLELLREAVPTMRRLAVLWTPANPLHAEGLQDLGGPARSFAIQLQSLKIVSAHDLDGAFASAATERSEAVWVFGDPLFSLHRARITALALSARLPTMFFWRGFVEAGGLMAFEPDWLHMNRRAAVHVDKILKGAKPADLPIEEPTKFELVINMKTAKALGLTIPPSLLLRANQVID